MATERKEKLIRVLQLMKTTDKLSPINASQIVRKLDVDFTLGKVDRRSIYRDIALLQSCGYDIKQCTDKKKGWYMDKHAFEDWEIKIMIDSIQQAKCVSESHAIAIQKKLLGLTSKRSKHRFSHMLKPVSLFNEADLKIGHYIEEMLEAMFIHKKVEFQYTEIDNKMKKVLRKEGKVYKLNLYTIYWSANNYYLIGSHDQHEGLTHYRLDRVVNLKVSQEDAIGAEEKLGPNPELFLQKYVEQSVNHFLGESLKVEVEYLPDPVTNAILYDFVGNEIKVKKHEEGLHRASFMKMNSVTLTGWFIQYANRIKVVAPASLKEAVAQELKQAVRIYSE